MRRVWPAANGILKPSGRGVGKPVHGVGPEVVILALLAVGDDRGAGRLEAGDGVADRLVVQSGRGRGRRSRFAATASMSSGGRGMLPMGSVGMGIGVLCSMARLGRPRRPALDAATRRSVRSERTSWTAGWRSAGWEGLLDGSGTRSAARLLPRPRSLLHLRRSPPGQHGVPVHAPVRDVRRRGGGVHPHLRVHRGHGVRARHGAAGLPDRGACASASGCGSSTSRTCSCSWCSWR